MKVLLVVHQYLPRHVTGTEQYVRALAREMLAAGVTAEVFAFEPLVESESQGGDLLLRRETVEGVTVHRYGLHEDLRPNHPLRDYASPLGTEVLARVLAAGGFDAMHVFHLRNIGVGAIHAAKAGGVPVVVHLMDFWFVCPNYLLWHRDGHLCDGPPDGGLGCIECVDPPLAELIDKGRLRAELRSVGDLPTPAGVQTGSPVRMAHALLGRQQRLFAGLAAADLVIAPSRFLHDFFVARGVDPQRLRHVPYGLDPGRFVDMPARKATPGRPHLDIGYVGSISRHKGVQVLLDAVAAVDDDRLRLHVHGRRFSQPGYSEVLLDGIRDPRVTFHGPFPPAELGQVLARLDALVAPSLWYENTPFSVLEALHVGVPVLASDLGGISEIVADRRNGRLFPAGDAAALAAVLRELLADPVGELAVTAGTTVPIADNAAEFVGLYRALAGGVAGARGARGAC